MVVEDRKTVVVVNRKNGMASEGKNAPAQPSRTDRNVCPTKMRRGAAAV